MADSSESSISISAPPSDILAVIADFASYPEWTGSVRRCEVLDEGSGGRAKRVRFTLDAGVVKDTYVLDYDWHGDSGVSWHLVEGKMQKSQEGSYTLAPGDGDTNVTYRLSVDLAVPMIGMFKRKAEKVIMDTALKELKKRVEAAG